LGAHGHFDLAASRAALAELARACRKRGINQALMDLRDLRPGPKPIYSRADLLTLINTFHEIGFTEHQRLAILYYADPHRRARLFASLSKQRGWTVQAFSNFEEALHWLSSGPQPQAQLVRSPQAKMIPVRILPAEENQPTTSIASPTRQKNKVGGPGKRVSANPRARNR
jgi:hypothetical protein